MTKITIFDRIIELPDIYGSVASSIKKRNKFVYLSQKYIVKEEFEKLSKRGLTWR